MNREQVIALAERAGLGDDLDRGTILVEDLLPFAALVAAQEREACAKVCEALLSYDMDDPGSSCAAAIRERKP